MMMVGETSCPHGAHHGGSVDDGGNGDDDGGNDDGNGGCQNLMAVHRLVIGGDDHDHGGSGDGGSDRYAS
jgi:hypothetical protein